MNLRRLIKKRARAALSGNRGSAVALILICLMVSVVINLLDAAALRMLGYEFTLHATNIYTYSSNFFYDLPAMGVSMGVWVVRMALVVPLGYGILNWHLELTDRRKQGVMHIFWPYESKAAIRGILLSLNILIKTTLLSSLLFVLPIILIVMSNSPQLTFELSMILLVFGLALAVGASLMVLTFYQRFAIASILICDKYQLTVHQAIKASVKYTRGHRFELVRFELSFLPWILPLLAAGGMMVFSWAYDFSSVMPFIWILVFVVVAVVTYLTLTPYYTMASVMYARYLYEYGVSRQAGAQPEAVQESSPANNGNADARSTVSQSTIEQTYETPAQQSEPTGQEPQYESEKPTQQGDDTQSL